VAGSVRSGHPRLWISYPWITNEERDFRYLILQLKDASIEAVYDSFQFMPNACFGQSILNKLESIGFDGWLYLLTYQCLTHRRYTDELSAAIDQARGYVMGPDFPIAGLQYGIASQHMPPALRTIPCVSLSDPNWKMLLSGVLKSSLAQGRNKAAQIETRFVWKVHPTYDGNPLETAVEVKTKVDEGIQYWRFALPKSYQAVQWGQGPSGGGEISSIRFAETRGSGRYEYNDVIWFGAANSISATESAYAVFSGPLPEFICFGPARSPFGPPGPMEVFRPNRIRQRDNPIPQNLHLDSKQLGSGESADVPKLSNPVSSRENFPEMQL